MVNSFPSGGVTPFHPFVVLLGVATHWVVKCRCIIVVLFLSVAVTSWVTEVHPTGGAVLVVLAAYRFVIFRAAAASAVGGIAGACAGADVVDGVGECRHLG